MRVLTGIYKGKQISMPQGIRPTQNRVRKAIFDILGDVKDLNFLELFAGSGVVGFEALSQGVKELVLVEAKRACVEVITKNILALGASNCQIIPLDAESAIKSLHKNHQSFEVIFLDPPYYQDTAKNILQTLSAYDILAPDGFLVIQHFKKDSLLVRCPVFGLVKESKYGDTILSFYRKIG